MVMGYFAATSALPGTVTSQLLAHNYPMPKSNSRSLKKQGSLVSQIWRFVTYKRCDNQDLPKKWLKPEGRSRCTRRLRHWDPWLSFPSFQSSL